MFHSSQKSDMHHSCSVLISDQPKHKTTDFTLKDACILKKKKKKLPVTFDCWLFIFTTVLLTTALLLWNKQHKPVNIWPLYRSRECTLNSLSTTTTLQRHTHTGTWWWWWRLFLHLRISGRMFDQEFPACAFFISPWWLSKLRRLWLNVPRQVVWELISR